VRDGRFHRVLDREPVRWTAAWLSIGGLNPRTVRRADTLWERRCRSWYAMLQELSIRNFALLEGVRLTFGPGLNVLTGETGAGKSIIIDAIGTVLGGRTTTEVVRTGAERASVEAIF